MPEILKYLMTAGIPTLFALALWWIQRRAGQNDKKVDNKDKVDSSYVDSRFEFTAKAESNLWSEIYTLRKDLAGARREAIEILYKYIDLVIECGKSDQIAAAREMMRRKLSEVQQEEQRKVENVERKVVEHQVNFARKSVGTTTDTEGQNNGN